MTCLLIVVWVIVFVMMVRAIFVKDILWPQKQEDRAEGGWQVPSDEARACDPRWCDNDIPMHGMDRANGVNNVVDDGTGIGGKQVNDSGFDDGATQYSTVDGLERNGARHQGWWKNSDNDATAHERPPHHIARCNASGGLETTESVADVAHMV